MTRAILDGKEHWDGVEDRTIPACSQCKSWSVGTKNCRAFPRGIPDEIFIHGNPHAKSFPGDAGIRFERLP